MASWRLQDAKNKFSELIERALEEGPQVITRHGIEVAVVLPYKSYRKLTEPGQRLGDILMSSPLRNCGLLITRDERTTLRDIDL